MLTPRARLAVSALGLLLAALAPVRAAYADEPPPATTTTTAPEGADEDISLDTPRSTMRGFLWAAADRDWDKAASHLDLRGRDAATGPVLARDLKTILDRKLWVDLDALDNTPDGETGDGQTRDRDVVGAIQTTSGEWVKILLERVPNPSGGRQWKVARVTLQQIPGVWAEFGDGPLAEILPQPFFDLHFLDILLWQWIALAVLLLAAVALARLLTTPVLRLFAAVARRTSSTIDDVPPDLIVGPIRMAVGTGIFLAGVYPIWLALRPHRFVTVVCEGLLTIAFTWLVLRLIDASATVMMRRYMARGVLAASSVVPLGRRAMKVFVALLALLAIFQNLGFNVTGILAGLGVGGLAVALAAQKSIENLFGGLSLIADQPVRVGDMCRFGSQQGTVEDIGLRSTRVRTLDRTVVTIPNADFATMQLENFGLRDRFRFAATIGVRSETTPDQLRWLLVELKKLLLAHPRVSPDPARVRFVGIGASSLDVELFAYVATDDYEEFTAVREDILLRIMDVVAAAGTGFAYPAQVAYSAQDAGIDVERQKAAEARVAAWRAGGALDLPHVPGDSVAELAGTLDWPPTGSSQRKK